MRNYVWCRHGRQLTGGWGPVPVKHLGTSDLCTDDDAVELQWEVEAVRTRVMMWNAVRNVKQGRLFDGELPAGRVVCKNTLNI